MSEIGYFTEKFGMARRNMLLRSPDTNEALKHALSECDLAMRHLPFDAIDSDYHVPYRQVRDAIEAMYKDQLPADPDERRRIAMAIDDLASWASRKLWSGE